jgi:malonyl-CoA O-methyltransferase
MKRLARAMRAEITGILSLNQLVSRYSGTAIAFERNIKWVKTHKIPQGGIAVTSRIKKSYPEVTGYFLESLLDWGERDLAFQFTDFLLDNQDESGGFFDPSGSSLCLFDTGQVIRGLIRVRNTSYSKNVDVASQKALKWICGLIKPDGSIDIPEEAIWGGVVPRAISLYALEPALRFAILIGDSHAESQINDAISYVVQHEDLDFASLNHFHAYIVEALQDLGYVELAREQMAHILSLEMKPGKLPAWPNKRWACSTAQFQYSKICYKQGNLTDGDRLFKYGLKYQNRSGGWFGTIGFLGQLLSPFSRINTKFSRYFPFDEISWANKYFMDSLTARMRVSFENLSHTFPSDIEIGDGRLHVLQNEIRLAAPRNVVDLGCGKGRYLTHLLGEFPDIKYQAVDISRKVMNGIPGDVVCLEGSLTNIPLSDNSTDFIYAIESLEHAIHIDGSLNEIARVLKPGGTVLIIDKNKFSLRRLKLPDWEQWFNTSKLASALDDVGLTTRIIERVPYEQRTDRLFTAWIGTKK